MPDNSFEITLDITKQKIHLLGTDKKGIYCRGGGGRGLLRALVIAP